MAATARPRISRDFIQAHQRTRILTGLAEAVVASGYRGASVADIVRRAGIARNTFYDNFSSKEDSARQLVAAVCPALDVKRLDPGCDGTAVLAVEVAARLRTGDSTGASVVISDAEQLLDRGLSIEPLEPNGTEDEPTLSTLPPGRHGLPREFVAKNQRARLLAGTADAIYEAGYAKATITDITRHAAVSRRTFYEHFDGKDQAAAALIDHSGLDVPESDSEGLAALWLEILSAAFAGDASASLDRRRRAQATLGILAAQLEPAVPA